MIAASIRALRQGKIADIDRDVGNDWPFDNRAGFG
jgi:hypothetical protein